MSTIYNFSAGPAVLPKSVLEQARDEMLDWHDSGMSVMEMSHRGKDFTAIAHQAEADLRELMAIPPNYKVLFLQGGATAQFAMVPLNLLRGKTSADYINTGIWSEKAIKEARRYAQVNVAASSADKAYTYAPAQADWQLDSNAAYVHYTPNETIGGVEFHWTPETGDVPLVADMSSNILSKPIDVSRFGVIYAGAQKNIGPAGLTLVIVREDLIGEVMLRTPTLYDYKVQAEQGSMYNTPPTYAMYIAGLVFQLLKREGGLAAMEQRNIAKATLLYDYLNASDFYHNPVAPDNRSRMNVPFTLSNPDLDAAFLQGAQQQGLLQLKGHALVGGMRASMYNAMPLAGVQALVEYMQYFVNKQG